MLRNGGKWWIQLFTNLKVVFFNVDLLFMTSLPSALMILPDGFTMPLVHTPTQRHVMH